MCIDPRIAEAIAHAVAAASCRRAAELNKASADLWRELADESSAEAAALITAVASRPGRRSRPCSSGPTV